MTAIEDSTPIKACTKCKECKPATVAFFNRDARGLAGLYAWCKSCTEHHHLANRSRIAAQRKSYRQANKDELRAKALLRHRERLMSDPLYAITTRVRGLIRAKIKSGGFTKKSRAGAILGCEWIAFKEHIERQFTKGMSWGNIREIHLDHIVPLSTAKTEADVIALNHFTNIRPMWAVDNMRKHDKLTHLL